VASSILKEFIFPANFVLKLFSQEILTNFVMKKIFARNCYQLFCKIFCIKHFSQQKL